jgi:hypothetical protein
MGAGTRILGGIVLVGFGALSGSFFYDYAHRPDIKEVGLITQSADTFKETVGFMDKLGNSYLTSDNRVLPLTYALDRLEIAKQDNPDQSKDIGRLISQIESVKDSKDISEDPLLYRTAILGLKTDLSDYAATGKDGSLIVGGVIFAIFSLFGAAVIVADIYG